jgi:hypothetical protein
MFKRTYTTFPSYVVNMKVTYKGRMYIGTLKAMIFFWAIQTKLVGLPAGKEETEVIFKKAEAYSGPGATTNDGKTRQLDYFMVRPLAPQTGSHVRII